MMRMEREKERELMFSAKIRKKGWKEQLEEKDEIEQGQDDL